MEQIIQLKSISDIKQLAPGWLPNHPLVSVIDFCKVDEYLPSNVKVVCDFYTVMFKNYCANAVRYGKNNIDFQEGSLICMAPGQAIVLDNEIEQRPDKMGWGLFFHSDLIHGTALGLKMKTFSFFAYETNEALHLSEKEKLILLDCIKGIELELNENIDKYSQSLIVTKIELLLNYCLRFYGRQFITRKTTNTNTVEQVEQAIDAYYTNPDHELLTVKELASMVNLSPNYLGDLLKKETGISAQEHIHNYLIETSKNLLLSSHKTVAEISFDLGFEYPQYFSRLFKKRTGQTPNEYRATV